MGYQSLLAVATWVIGVTVSAAKYKPQPLPVSSVSTCNGIKYINRGLVAYGTVASDARDKVGDTLGGFGSATAPDVSSFSLLRDGTVAGTLFGLPDRGWNTEGTIDYQNRLQTFHVTFQPTFGSVDNSSQNLQMQLKDTTLLYKDKKPTTGLEAAKIIPSHGNFPDLPAAQRSDGKLAPAIDAEGLVRLHDGSFWISDEYGPYVYYFSKKGEMLAAIEPPVSFIPFTDGEKSFLSGNPPVGSDEKAADDPATGRANNHGFEGLAISNDERYLTVQLQEALVQDGGTHGTRSNNTRQLSYDIRDRLHPRLVAEHVIQQPAINDPSEDKNPRSTSVSELHWLSDTEFLILARDSGHGRGSGSDTASTYRHIDIISTKGADDVKTQDSGPGALAVAPDGYLNPGVEVDRYCNFIDFNNNTDLGRFGLHNGPPFDGELNEKWESISVIPVPKGAKGYGKDEFYMISISDNDFITQNGYYNFGKTRYSDASGLNVDTQVLVWQVNLPGYVARH